MLRLLKLCTVHDLGDAIHGNIPAVEQVDKGGSKSRSAKTCAASRHPRAGGRVFSRAVSILHCCNVCISGNIGMLD